MLLQYLEFFTLKVIDELNYSCLFEDWSNSNVSKRISTAIFYTNIIDSDSLELLSLLSFCKRSVIILGPCKNTIELDLIDHIQCCLGTWLSTP